MIRPSSVAARWKVFSPEIGQTTGDGSIKRLQPENGTSKDSSPIVKRSLPVANLHQTMSNVDPFRRRLFGKLDFGHFFGAIDQPVGWAAVLLWGMNQVDKSVETESFNHHRLENRSFRIKMEDDPLTASLGSDSQKRDSYPTGILLNGQCRRQFYRRAKVARPIRKPDSADFRARNVSNWSNLDRAVPDSDSSIARMSP